MNKVIKKNKLIIVFRINQRKYYKKNQLFDLNEDKLIPLIISLIKEIRSIITGAANECVFSTARDLFSY